MTIPAKKVLLVDDEEKLLNSIAQRMKVLGFGTFTAINGLTAIDVCMKNDIDLAIVDLRMPDMNGLVTITKLKEIRPGLKTILLTGHGSEKVRQATEALNTVYFEKDEMGAFWRYIKTISTDPGKIGVARPLEAIGHPGGGTQRAAAVETRPPRDSGLAEHRVAAHPSSPARAGETERLRLVGETLAMQSLQKNIARVAQLDCTVTLRGEPGTGKELAARIIHAGSIRHQHRFLAINCSIFGSEQLSDQLLGGKSANLSDAIRSRNGIFRTGRVGTLYFDQIEKMPAPMQAQLLDILGMIDDQRSGGAAASSLDLRGLDIRVIVATTTDLGARATAGAFRQDLRDRLKWFELSIPPLRERRDDIPPLCRYFFDYYCQELGKAVDSISPEVVRILLDYDFPGNVGELEHIIERAVILAGGKTIERRHLPARFLEKPKTPAPTLPDHLSTLADLESRYIVEVLDATNGNKSKTAEILGISRAALWRKLKLLKTERPDP
jgi:DNA-binding NtrC family response regulator